MTDVRRARRVQLDPCIRLLGRPMGPGMNVPAYGLSPEARLPIDRSIGESFEEIRSFLEVPPEAWEDDERQRRYVRLWGALDISVSWSGVDLLAELVDGLTLPKHAGVLVDLSWPISTWRWCDVVVWILRRHFRSAGVSADAPDSRAARYLHRVLAKTFEHYVDWSRLRRLVRSRLHPHPLCVSLVHRVFGRDLATVDAFNWTARNREELALIAIEHPGLLPFMRLMTWQEGSLRRSFDGFLTMYGIKPSARRKLEKWGFAPFDEARERFPHDDALEAVSRTANLFDALNVTGSPPAIYGAMAGAALASRAPEWFQRALWNEVVALMDCYPDEDPLPDNLEEALDWIHGQPRVEGNQQRAGWAWISRQASAREQERDPLDRVEWPVPCGAQVIDGYAVVPLRCARELHEEGMKMCNCIASFAHACRKGRIAAFSIRRGDRRVACFTLEHVPGREPPWAVDQLGGKANSEVPELAGIPRTVAAMLSQG